MRFLGSLGQFQSINLQSSRQSITTATTALLYSCATEPAPIARPLRNLSVANLESTVVTPGQIMGGHDRPAVPVEEAEHEYDRHHPTTPGLTSLTLPTAMRRSHRTFRLARTCWQARSQVLLYASGDAATGAHALKNTSGTLGDVPC